MSELRMLASQVVAFRDEREWKQFHNPKDLALSLVLESAELLEIFQWKDAAATQQAASTQKAALSDELADVLYYVLLMAHDLEIDLPQALIAKLAGRGACSDQTQEARARERSCSHSIVISPTLRPEAVTPSRSTPVKRTLSAPMVCRTCASFFLHTRPTLRSSRLLFPPDRRQTS